MMSGSSTICPEKNGGGGCASAVCTYITFLAIVVVGGQTKHNFSSGYSWAFLTTVFRYIAKIDLYVSLCVERGLLKEKPRYCLLRVSCCAAVNSPLPGCSPPSSPLPPFPSSAEAALLLSSALAASSAEARNPYSPPCPVVQPPSSLPLSPPSPSSPAITAAAAAASVNRGSQVLTPPSNRCQPDAQTGVYRPDAHLSSRLCPPPSPVGESLLASHRHPDLLQVPGPLVEIPSEFLHSGGGGSGSPQNASTTNSNPPVLTSISPGMYSSPSSQSPRHLCLSPPDRESASPPGEAPAANHMGPGMALSSGYHPYEVGLCALSTPPPSNPLCASFGSGGTFVKRNCGGYSREAPAATVHPSQATRFAPSGVGDIRRGLEGSGFPDHRTHNEGEDGEKVASRYCLQQEEERQGGGLHSSQASSSCRVTPRNEFPQNGEFLLRSPPFSASSLPNPFRQNHVYPPPAPPPPPSGHLLRGNSNMGGFDNNNSSDEAGRGACGVYTPHAPPQSTQPCSPGYHANSDHHLYTPKEPRSPSIGVPPYPGDANFSLVSPLANEDRRYDSPDENRHTQGVASSHPLASLSPPGSPQWRSQPHTPRSTMVDRVRSLSPQHSRDTSPASPPPPPASLLPPADLKGGDFARPLDENMRGIRRTEEPGKGRERGRLSQNGQGTEREEDQEKRCGSRSPHWRAVHGILSPTSRPEDNRFPTHSGEHVSEEGGTPKAGYSQGFSNCKQDCPRYVNRRHEERKERRPFLLIWYVYVYACTGNL